jgi:hypothetical protein
VLKSASRSITSVLLPKFGPKIEPEVAYKSFTVVRNPYDRFQSALSMFANGARPPVIWVTGRQMFGEVTFDKVFALLEDENAGFNYRHFAGLIRLHILPMTHLHIGADKADKVFRFENLETEWDEIADFANVPRKSIVYKGAGNPKVELTQMQRDQLYEYFKLDFETFDYKR